MMLDNMAKKQHKRGGKNEALIDTAAQLGPPGGSYLEQQK